LYTLETSIAARTAVQHRDSLASLHGVIGALMSLLS